MKNVVISSSRAVLDVREISWVIAEIAVFLLAWVKSAQVAIHYFVNNAVRRRNI